MQYIHIIDNGWYTWTRRQFTMPQVAHTYTTVSTLPYLAFALSLRN